jgi:hypothetical protein
MENIDIDHELIQKITDTSRKVKEAISLIRLSIPNLYKFRIESRKIGMEFKVKLKTILYLSNNTVET